jgi:hypothetical protein
MTEQDIRQAIAITTGGQVMQVGLPRPANVAHDFIKSFIGSPEPWEVYLTNIPEVVWSSKDDADYGLLPANPIATMIIRTIYQNQIDVVRGNVLITGIGTDSDKFVSTIDPNNLEFVLAYGNAVKDFLAKVEDQFDVSFRKGE